MQRPCRSAASKTRPSSHAVSGGSRAGCSRKRRSRAALRWRWPARRQSAGAAAHTSPVDGRQLTATDTCFAAGLGRPPTSSSTTRSPKCRTPLAAICCEFVAQLAMQQAVSCTGNRQIIENLEHIQNKFYNTSPEKSRPTRNPQHRDMSRRCTACCTTCRPASPQQIEIVEFDLCGLLVGYIRHCVH